MIVIEGKPEKKHRLETGYVVEIRQGGRYVVFLEKGILAGHNKMFGHGFLLLSQYDSDLLIGIDDDFDIVKTYKPRSKGHYGSTETGSLVLLWTRDD